VPVGRPADDLSADDKAAGWRRAAHAGRRALTSSFRSPLLPQKTWLDHGGTEGDLIGARSRTRSPALTAGLYEQTSSRVGEPP
jgi:hypothetical protein